MTKHISRALAGSLATVVGMLMRLLWTRVPWVSGVVILAHITLVPLLYAWGAWCLFDWQPFPWDEFYAFFPPSGEYPLPRHDYFIHFTFATPAGGAVTAPLECLLIRLGLMLRNELAPALGVALVFAILGIARYRLTRRWVDFAHWLLVIIYLLLYLGVTLALWRNGSWAIHPY